MVCTIEPRKNHLLLLDAWEHLREISAARHASISSLSGRRAGEHHAIVQRCTPWLQRGGLHFLENVPSDDLRLLYRHARVTVCPSFGEGFDFPGVEAMRCGGVVAASDIPVHRGVFDGACEYFSPYSSEELLSALERLLGTRSEARRAELRVAGKDVAFALHTGSDFARCPGRIPCVVCSRASEDIGANVPSGRDGGTRRFHRAPVGVLSGGNAMLRGRALASRVKRRIRRALGMPIATVSVPSRRQWFVSEEIGPMTDLYFAQCCGLEAGWDPYREAHMALARVVRTRSRSAGRCLRRSAGAPVAIDCRR